jgi:hypothetical protein
MKQATLTFALILGCSAAAAGAALSTTQRTDVNRAMQTIEQRSDQFEKHFLRDLNSSTLDIEDRDRYRRWVDQLEDSLDNMKEAWDKDNMAETREELQDALEVASSVNRFMLRSKWSPESEREWAEIRDNINTIAGVHKQPAVPSLGKTASK